MLGRGFVWLESRIDCWLLFGAFLRLVRKGPSERRERSFASCTGQVTISTFNIVHWTLIVVWWRIEIDRDREHRGRGGG